jgi:hypothetical protein
MWRRPFCVNISWPWLITGSCLYLLTVPTERSKGCSSCGEVRSGDAGVRCRSKGMGGGGRAVGADSGRVHRHGRPAHSPRHDCHQSWCWPLACAAPYHWRPVFAQVLSVVVLSSVSQPYSVSVQSCHSHVCVGSQSKRRTEQQESPRVLPKVALQWYERNPKQDHQHCVIMAAWTRWYFKLRKRMYHTQLTDSLNGSGLRHRITTA